INAKLVNIAIYKTATRPYAFSTMSPYTSWDSLTDRTFSGRHLPESTTDPSRLPPVADVVELFRRGPEGTTLSDKSTLLFPYFAQWFTDGFLRTDRTDQRKNTSNHEIDLSQLYGLDRSITPLIRTGKGGRLKSQFLGAEEYPPYYYEGGEPKPEFRNLPIRIIPGLPPERMATLFAMGGERSNVNIGYAMMNTLFLREHNRICAEMGRAYPQWDDERLFQTARNVLIVLLIKIVIEEYINHITPYYYKFKLDPTASPDERWRRQNWMSVEFNLLYRWHSLVPDTIRIDGKDFAVADTSFNNALITGPGLGASFDAATRQPAGRIGVRNTPDFLLSTEQASIELGRLVKLRSYNDYREACQYPRVTDVDQITGVPEVQAQLRSLYRHVDDIEFSAGLFAEDTREHSAVGPMIGRLVGVDAFSQALTNPLLSHNVYNSDTFSRAGWTIIHETKSLAEIVRRNLPAGRPTFRVSLTREGAKVE
ncbi:MAG TPA: peroxidase family protein, partial [Isosphaeraceae bacterium]|nr:peroxidase family protein [Isosphaeraceae bacterium]